MAKHLDVAPALLCKSKQEFLQKLKLIEPYAHRAQVDVMDGAFVPNTTVQPAEFARLKTRVKLEIQLMVKHPADYLHDCCRMNAWTCVWRRPAISRTRSSVWHASACCHISPRTSKAVAARSMRGIRRYA